MMQFRLELSGLDACGVAHAEDIGGKFLSLIDAQFAAKRMSADDQFFFGRVTHYRIKDQGGVLIDEGDPECIEA